MREEEEGRERERERLTLLSTLKQLWQRSGKYGSVYRDVYIIEWDLSGIAYRIGTYFVAVM